MKNRKLFIAGAVGLLLLLLTRRTASAASSVTNAAGIAIKPGQAYRAAAGYQLRELESPYSIFATTGTNANFYITGTVTVAINGVSTPMAIVTYIQNGTPVYEWEFLININAFTGLYNG